MTIRRMPDGTLKEFRPWRRIDDERLRKLWVTHLSDKEIARRLDHSIGAIRCRAAVMGLPNRREIWALEAAE